MPELYPEDQEKVDKYLQSSVHQVDRKPFRPLLLLLVLFVFLAGFTWLAFYIASFKGVV